MFFGRSVIAWIIIAFLVVVVFLLAQWLIPLLFVQVGVVIPAHIVNLLAILVAFGVGYGGYARGAVVA